MDEVKIDLEDILREFGDPPKKTPEDTVRFSVGDTIEFPSVTKEEVSDTRRFEAVGDSDISDTKRFDAVGDTRRLEPYSDKWEPEYEQPMGSYTPPQPITFRPKSPQQELKRKLAAGPEQQHRILTEQGTGKLQLALFFSLLVVIISAISTGMYALGLVQANRMGLVVYGQLIAIFVSAFLGGFQLLDGISDMRNKRFTLNSMLVVTFLICIVDGIVCLKQMRVPCGSVFSLQMSMSLFHTYLRRNTEISQMDTLRNAEQLTGIQACKNYYEDATGLLKTEGRLEDFMDSYDCVSKPEKQLEWYGLIATVSAFIIGIVAGCMFGISAAVQVTAVSLTAAMPATVFISQSRPTWILQKRLRKLGTVLCGWDGVEGLSEKAVFPVTYRDMFTDKDARLSGMKFFGSREPAEIVAYATALSVAEDNGLTEVFSQVLDSYNGKHYDAFHLLHYENGGLGGVVNGEIVLMGSAYFMRKMEIAVPDSAKLNQAIYVSIEGELCGLFAVSYDKAKTTLAGLSTLTSYKDLSCVITSDDFMLTHSFFNNRFGIKAKRLLLPDWDTRKQLREKSAPATAPMLLLTVSRGLAPLAYGVTGARMLKKACRMGSHLHMAGGIVGLLMMLLLVLLGGVGLITSTNIFLYQLVWMIPAMLITEWTRTL